MNTTDNQLSPKLLNIETLKLQQQNNDNKNQGEQYKELIKA
jgi:hypothetical protein